MAKDIRNIQKNWFKKQLSLFSIDLVKTDFGSDNKSIIVHLPANTWVDSLRIKTLKAVTGAANADVGWEGTGNATKITENLAFGSNVGDIVSASSMPIDVGDIGRNIVVTLDAAMTDGEIRIVMALLETTTSIYDKFDIPQTPAVSQPS